MKIEYRAYFFGNMYLSPIQQGIQAAHVISDMFIDNDDDYYSPLIKWAEHDKTIILLNGGYQSVLLDIYIKLKNLTSEVYLNVGKFHEERDALNGTCTSVGIIVPNYIYDTVESTSGLPPSELLYAELFNKRLPNYNVPESWNVDCLAIHNLLKQFRLA